MFGKTVNLVVFGWAAGLHATTIPDYLL